MAETNRGFYSEREFNFGPYQPLQERLIELGRACIHREHRSTGVLDLLWKGIGRYAVARDGRYLIGCCSLTSQDPAQGSAAYERLRAYEVEPELRTVPQPSFGIPPVPPQGRDAAIPKLLRTYLAVGARICGPPALDWEFKTIDFLTLLDLEALHPRLRTRFLKSE